MVLFLRRPPVAPSTVESASRCPEGGTQAYITLTRTVRPCPGEVGGNDNLDEMEECEQEDRLLHDECTSVSIFTLRV